MSQRQTVQTAKCPNGEMPHGELSHGEMSHGEVSVHGAKYPGFVLLHSVPSCPGAHTLLIEASNHMFQTIELSDVIDHTSWNPNQIKTLCLADLTYNC